jgi:hypothetical protein
MGKDEREAGLSPGLLINDTVRKIKNRRMI